MQPQAQLLRDDTGTGVDPSGVASRKSARRGEETVISAGGPHVDPASAITLQPPPPLTTTASHTTYTHAYGSARHSSAGYEALGASLSPRGYTAACRAAEQQIAPSIPQAHFPSSSLADGSAPSRPSPAPQRLKRRRTEQITFSALFKEVFMYLDAVAATQHDSPSQVDGEAEEDDVERRRRLQQRWGSARSPHTAASPTLLDVPCTAPSPSVSSEESSAVGSSEPPAAAAVLGMSIDAAVQDTLRVLRACWEYSGAPHDAFEPVRLLSPITVHLLTTYGHHTLTHRGDYVVLRGGAEQLPWVGCLYGILQAYAYRSGSGGEGASAAWGGQPGAISRILLMNCHSFGWMDQVGTDEYERSHRRLYQAREALTSLLEDHRYRHVGQRAACPLCSATMTGGDASTSVLLGDTIVMEGGVPSLGLAASRDTFTAHYQYGRGIACCVPEQRPAGQAHTPADALHGGGAGREDGSASLSGLCAVHQHQHRHHRATSRWPALNSYTAEEESSLTGRRNINGTARHGLAVPTTADLSHFPPVCCGTCRAAGVLGQAVLLGPTGPLLLHLQFEEREWLEAAAPLAAPEGFGGGYAGPGGWAMTETAAVCPAPLLNAAAFRANPAAALAAVLYAQMQSCDVRRNGASRRGGAPSAFTTTSASSSSSLYASAPASGGGGGGTVSLAEFVEWLVRLLHSPPPALVVEWHASSPGMDGACGEGSTQRGYGAVSSAGSSACGSPTRGVHAGLAATSPYPEHSAVAGTGHSSSSSIEQVAFTQPYQEAEEQNSSASPPPPPPPPPSSPNVPLGMAVRPRVPVVPQLLETYADVMLSRPLPAAPPQTKAVPLSVAYGGRPGQPVVDQHSLQTALSHAAAQTEEHDRVLVEWVLAAHDALRPCDATAYFDGVERPLVLSKALEVVAEGERYVSANSVVTSLQFRPRPSGAREHYETTG